MHIDTPRLPLHLTFRIVYDLLSLSQRVSERGKDDAYFSQPHGTSSTLANGQSYFGMSHVLEPDTHHVIEDNFSRIIRVARSLYRCHLGCKDAFPSQEMKEQWIAAVWREASEKTGGYPGPATMADEACSVSYRMMHEFTWILSS
jgi:hypothetical protein